MKLKIIFILIFIHTYLHFISCQNSMVGDGFGGRSWYKPSTYSVGSYSAYSICYEDPCGFSQDNQLYAWGANFYGQLGNGKFGINSGVDFPFPVPNMTNVKYYTCGYVMGVIKQDLTAWIWGGVGILGDTILKPIKVSDSVYHADAGAYGVFFVHTNGTVSGISPNYFGECGNGTQNPTTKKPSKGLKPIKMLNVQNAVRIANAYNQNLILLKDGTLMSVGLNNNGLLGLGLKNDTFIQKIPVPIKNISDIVDIKANSGSFAALDKYGNVYTWGTYGMHGHKDSLNDVNKPTQLKKLKNIVALSACTDGFHFFALDANQKVYAWGQNFWGEIGLPVPILLEPTFLDSNVIDILAGETFSYLVKNDGSLWCSGQSADVPGTVWLDPKKNTGFSFAKIYPEKYFNCPPIRPMEMQIDINDTSCHTIVQINMKGGQAPYKYNIGLGDQKNNMFTNLKNGKYKVSVTDSRGCSLSEEFEIKNPNIIIPQFDSIFPICEGQQLNPLLSTSLNGINGKWIPAFDNTKSNTYLFIVDSISCFDTISKYIEVVKKIVPTFDSIQICAIDTINPLPLISKNGIYGHWDIPFDNTQSKRYTFIPDSNQCAESILFSVRVNPLVIPDFENIPVQCEGTHLTSPLKLISKNNIIGSWTPIFDNSNTTLYTFTPDFNQCATKKNLLIEINKKEIPLFDSITPICEGKNLLIPTISKNGFSGKWSPSFDNLNTTNYTFKPDSNQCATTMQLLVKVNKKIISEFDPITAICQGDYFELPMISKNGFAGKWYPEFKSDSSRLYIFNPDTNYCATSGSLKIEIKTKVIPEFDKIADKCAGEIILPLSTISKNGIKGKWFPPIDNSQTLKYTFTPDSFECANSNILQIVVNQKIIPNFTPIEPLCANSQVLPLNLLSTNGISGTWFPAFDNQKTQEYTFTPDTQFCSQRIKLLVQIIPNKQIDFAQPDPICQGEILSPLSNISTTGIKGYWTPIVDNKNTTEYTFHAYPNQCVYDTIFKLQIVVHDLPIADAGRDTSIFSGQSIQLMGAGGKEYTWTPDIELDCPTCQFPICKTSQTRNYLLQVKDEHGCIDTDAIIISVKEEKDVFVPNTFSPNNDLVNDILTIESADKSYIIKKIQIFDRWGEEIYSSTTTGWNGQFRSQPAPPGLYLYLIDAENDHGIKKRLVGDCTLIR